MHGIVIWPNTEYPFAKNSINFYLKAKYNKHSKCISIFKKKSTLENDNCLKASICIQQQQKKLNVKIVNKSIRLSQKRSFFF